MQTGILSGTIYTAEPFTAESAKSYPLPRWAIGGLTCLVSPWLGFVLGLVWRRTQPEAAAFAWTSSIVSLMFWGILLPALWYQVPSVWIG
jgi:hypothetical protein